MRISILLLLASALAACALPGCSSLRPAALSIRQKIKLEAPARPGMGPVAAGRRK